MSSEAGGDPGAGGGGSGAVCGDSGAGGGGRSLARGQATLREVSPLTDKRSWGVGLLESEG